MTLLNKAALFLALVLLPGLVLPSDAEAKDEVDLSFTGVCAGDSEASVCLNWIDMLQLYGTQFRFNGLSVAGSYADLRTRRTQGENFEMTETLGHIMSANLGWQYRFFDEKLSADAAFGDPYGSLALNLLRDDILLSAVLFFGDTFTQITSTAAQDLAPVGVFEAGGHAITTVRALEIGDTQLILSGLLRGDKTIVSSPTVTLPKGEFDQALELILVNSRELEEGDVEASFLRGHAMAKLLMDFEIISASVEAKVPFATSDAFSTAGISASASLRLAILSGWLELHANGKVQQSFARRAPVFLLPSLGGAYGMKTYFRGNFANLTTNVGDLQIGAPFARLFVEQGASGGVGESISVSGTGLLIDFFGFTRLSSEKALQSGAMGLFMGAIEPEIILGFNNQGFVFNFLASAEWEF